MNRLPGKVDPRLRTSLPPETGWTPINTIDGNNCLIWLEVRREGEYTNNDAVEVLHDWSENGYDLTTSDLSAYTFHSGAFPSYIDGMSSTSPLHNSSFPALGGSARTLILVETLTTDAISTWLGAIDQTYSMFGIKSGAVRFGYDGFGFTPFATALGVTICTFHGNDADGTLRVYSNSLDGAQEGAYDQLNTYSGISVRGQNEGVVSPGGKFYALAVFEGVLSNEDMEAALDYFTMTLPAGQWAPNNSGAELFAWYQPGISSVTLYNTDEVSLLQDASGNGHHVEESGSTGDPITFVAGDFPYLIHTGTGDYILQNTSFPALDNTKRTVVLVGGLKDDALLSMMGTDADCGFAVAPFSHELQLGCEDPDYDETFDETDQRSILILTWDNDKFEVWNRYIRVLDFHPSDPVDTQEGITLFGSNTADLLAFDARFYALAVWNGVFNETDRHRAMDYFDMAAGYNEISTMVDAVYSDSGHEVWGPPEAAVDRNKYGQWASLTGDTAWWQVEFPSAQTIQRIDLSPAPIDGFDGVPHFQLLASNTGVFGGEEDLLVESDTPNMVYERYFYTFANSTDYLYYRILISGVTDGQYRLSELYLYELS